MKTGALLDAMRPPAIARLEPQVTVIVPTTAQLSRRMEIERCLASIRASSAQPVRIIVVVNGQRYDEGVCDWLRAQADVRYAYAELPSAPNAVWEGRRMVDTPYFSMVDDDDEYLPGATDLKLEALRAQPQADLVVTNAYRRFEGVDALLYNHLARVRREPLAMLFEANWLTNGNALYRTDSVGPAYFADYQPYAEWTWLAFKLSLDGKQVATIEQPTFRVHVTGGSLSQSDAYFEFYLSLYQQMLAAGPPPAIERRIRRHLSGAQHDHSVRALGRGRWREALGWHWRSLRQPGGLQYLSYTRHFLLHFLRPPPRAPRTP